MGECILVVDDNPTNLKLVRYLLVRRGYDVHTAQDAVEALKLLESLHPRLILMDLQMPGIDGLELTRRIKASSATHSVPVVALTAFAMRGDEQRARAAGCDGYVTKPLDTRTFPDVVAGFLARSTGGTP